MAERVWDKYISERDRAVFDASGFGAASGYGERPALLIVDVSYAFCGDRPEPVLDSIKRWKLSCGEVAWETIPTIRKLIDAAHEKRLPVIYTTSQRRGDNWNMGSWLWKNPIQFDGDKDEPEPAPASNRNGDDIVDEIKPAPQDIVVYKNKPSGFFEAPMLSYLKLLNADSVIITGTTTSGCVRATAVDAFSHNLRVAVVEDGCFDRSELSHAVSLMDMHAKYADVVDADGVTEYFDGLADGLFQLPDGQER